MRAVDQADSAQYSLEEVLHPGGWTLLNFLMDSRTGLGRFRDFRISNYQLMMQLIDLCFERSVDEILEHPDVAERVALYREHAEAAKEQILRCSTVHGRVVVLDLREEEIIHPTNRFMVRGIPTLVVLKDGELVDTLVGLRGKEEITQVLDKHLA